MTTIITIKSFRKDEKGIYCKRDSNKFYYEIGVEYKIPNERDDTDYWITAASANCDINETLIYEVSPKKDGVYGLVELRGAKFLYNLAKGSSIKVLKWLSIEECMSYDNTGHWCYEYTKAVGVDDIKKMEDAIIEKDKEGIWCYYFAKDIKGADIKRLEEAVIQKDWQGYWCYRFAEDIEGCDIQRLQEEVIKKDYLGMWSYYFGKYVKGADKKRLLKIADERGYIERLKKKKLEGFIIELDEEVK